MYVDVWLSYDPIWNYIYRDEIYSLQILLSRTQAGPGRTVKQEQEEISPNHVQRINLISVTFCHWRRYDKIKRLIKIVSDRSFYFAVASSHRSAAKYSVDDNDSSSEPIYQGIVEMDIGAIRKVGELDHL